MLAFMRTQCSTYSPQRTGGLQWREDRRGGGGPAISAELVYSAIPKEGGIKYSLAAYVCLNSPSESLYPALSWLALLGIDCK